MGWDGMAPMSDRKADSRPDSQADSRADFCIVSKANSKSVRNSEAAAHKLY